jgi:hypothetical protein
MVPYTVSRCVRGAYVDDKGVTYACDGPGRTFKECASYKVVNTYTTKKMVQEHCVKTVHYTVNEIVCEKQIKRVPYQVCRMVPHTVIKKVPYTVCEQEKFTVCRKVAYTECVKQPYTVHCKVPYTVTETVACPVTRQVKVCVPETVCVKKARLVPVTVACEPCPAKACCDKGCGNTCCESKCCFMDRLRQRWFASLCSTGCCEETYRTRCKATCTTRCNDCHDYCREGLLQRLFRNRFACEPSCCDSGSSSRTMAPTMPTMPSAEQINLPRALPKD